MQVTRTEAGGESVEIVFSTNKHGVGLDKGGRNSAGFGIFLEKLGEVKEGSVGFEDEELGSGVEGVGEGEGERAAGGGSVGAEWEPLVEWRSYVRRGK